MAGFRRRFPGSASIRARSRQSARRSWHRRAAHGRWETRTIEMGDDLPSPQAKRVVGRGRVGERSLPPASTSSNAATRFASLTQCKPPFTAPRGEGKKDPPLLSFASTLTAHPPAPFNRHLFNGPEHRRTTKQAREKHHATPNAFRFQHAGRSCRRQARPDHRRARDADLPDQRPMCSTTSTMPPRCSACRPSATSTPASAIRPAPCSRSGSRRSKAAPRRWRSPPATPPRCSSSTR